MTKAWTSQFVNVMGFRTHYVEAGAGRPLVLLHGGEYGACAEFTWEFNIAALAEHFHVIAPDWLGYGQSEKIFSFEDMLGLRIRHIAEFLKTVGIDRADFMGSSMGGTTLAQVAAYNDGRWPIKRAVLVSGGGYIPENGPRATLTDYDGSIEGMRAIYKTLFRNPAIRDNEAMIARHHAASLEKGSWECTAAPRFKSPAHPPKPFQARVPDYSQVSVPVYIMAGVHDNLRTPGYGRVLQESIPGSELVELDGGHCHQIDMPETFNKLALDYLLRD